MLLVLMAIILSVEARTRAVWYSDEAVTSDVHDVSTM